MTIGAGTLLLLSGVVLAQTSTSFTLEEYTFNAGGGPSQGVQLSSSSFRITVTSIGETVVATGLGSGSFGIEAGFPAITQAAQVTSNAPPTDTLTSLVSATPGTVPADGTTSATLTVTLLDSLSVPVVGHAVSVAQTGSSSIGAASGVSDVNGQVTFAVTDTTAETVTYTATDVTNGVTVTQTAQVTFSVLPADAFTSLVSATPGAVPADGITSATLTVTLLDSLSAPVVGHAVSVAQTGSSGIGAPSGLSDLNGQVSFAVTDTTAETVTYTATDNTDGVTVTQTAQVVFGGMITDAGTSSVMASASNVLADGTSSATLTVTLLDSLSAPVVGHAVSLAQTGSSSIGVASGVSDLNGQVTFAVTDTTAETVTYTATDVTNGVPILDTAVVTFDAVPGGTFLIDVQVAASSDDAEEGASGSISLGSSDLELVFDGGGNQTVGLRFTGVAIPQGATIVEAFVRFQVDEVSSGATSLTIEGEATDHALTFIRSTGNISSRSRTGASVVWVPAPWSTVGQAGPAQQTSGLAAVVQEIVNRSGWASGNSLVFTFSGSGERVAESFNGAPGAAPLLHVEYQAGPP